MLGERYELRDLWGGPTSSISLRYPWQTLQQLSLQRDGERTVKDRQASQTFGSRSYTKNDARCDVIDAFKLLGTYYIIGGRKRYEGNG